MFKRWNRSSGRSRRRNGEGRREVESGDGGGMDSSVETAKVLSDAEKCVDKDIAEDFMDVDNVVDMGFGP